MIPVSLDVIDMNTEPTIQNTIQKESSPQTNNAVKNIPQRSMNFFEEVSSAFSSLGSLFSLEN